MPEGVIVSPGIYANLFNVRLNEESVDLMTIGVGHVPEYDSLKAKLQLEGVSFLYYDYKEIYGDSKDPSILSNHGFVKRHFELQENPRLVARMILQGFIDKVSPDFNIVESKGRLEFVSKRKCASAANGQVAMYRAYDIRCIFLKDCDTGNLEFGVVIDVNFKLKSQAGEPLNSHDIRIKFGQGALSEIRRFQGELVPGGKINTEISRQRLLEDIIPFIQQYSNIELPGRIGATINAEPVHVVLGSDL